MKNYYYLVLGLLVVLSITFLFGDEVKILPIIALVVSTVGLILPKSKTKARKICFYIGLVIIGFGIIEAGFYFLLTVIFRG